MSEAICEKCWRAAHSGPCESLADRLARERAEQAKKAAERLKRERTGKMSGSEVYATPSSPRITPSIQRIVREARADGLSVAEMLEDVQAHSRRHQVELTSARIISNDTMVSAELTASDVLHLIEWLGAIYTGGAWPADRPAYQVEGGGRG